MAIGGGTLSLQGVRNYYQSNFPVGWAYNLLSFVSLTTGGPYYYYFYGPPSNYGGGSTNGSRGKYGTPMHMFAFYGTSPVDEWPVSGGGGGK